MGGVLPVPGQTMYGASKAAVKLLTEGLYAELLDTNVKVSVILPGAVATAISRTPGSPMPEADEGSVRSTPSKAAPIIIDGIERDRCTSMSAPTPGDEPCDQGDPPRRHQVRAAADGQARAHPPGALMTDVGTTVSPVRLNHAVLFVADLERAERSTPRCSAWRSSPTEPRADAAFLRPTLREPPRPRPFGVGPTAAPKVPGGIGLYHLAWQLDTITSLTAAREALHDADALRGVEPRRDEVVYGADPDGNEFEVMWMLPRSAWVSTRTRLRSSALDLAAEVRRGPACAPPARSSPAVSVTRPGQSQVSRCVHRAPRFVQREAPLPHPYDGSTPVPDHRGHLGGEPLLDQQRAHALSRPRRRLRRTGRMRS